jgi:hypothetical protein
MYEVFDSPITKKNMPWAVRDMLNDHRCEDLVEISRHSYGTPDGECDTDAWNFTFVNREAKTVTFVTYIYKNTTDVLALPDLIKYSYWATWIDHGTQYITKRSADGEATITTEEIVIDHDKIRRMIYKMLEKKTIDLEAA